MLEATARVATGKGLTSPHSEIPSCYKMLHRVLDSAGPYRHSNEFLFP